MNLKEAFRFQNRLSALMSEAQTLLSDDANTTQITRTYLRKKVFDGAENETVLDAPVSEFAPHMTEMVGFLLYLLAQREQLSAAIRATKQGLPIDLDSEVSLNAQRQEIARVLQHMADLRSSEVLLRGGGTGYRFNQEGNQVAYRCDVKQVTTIAFDRKVIRNHVAALHRRSDAVSSELDRCMVNYTVAYDPPFDVNDSFAEVFSTFLRADESA